MAPTTLGSGRSAGYDEPDRPLPGQPRPLQVFGQVNNLFDREFTTAAQLGSTAFSASGGVLTQPFG